MGRWLDLHIQLAETVGDPRTKTGVFISSTTDNGIRYTADQRSRVLSQAIRWLIVNFNYDWYYWWMPLLVVDETTTPISGEDMGYGTTIPKIVTLQNSFIRILSIEGAMIMTVDPETNLPVNYYPPIMIPIIDKTHKKLLKTKNSHWDNTPFAYAISNNTIGIINSKNYNTSITYIRDFDYSIDDMDLFVPINIMHYIIIYAVYLLKLNEQRWEEAMKMKNDMITEIATFINLEEKNVGNKIR